MAELWLQHLNKIYSNGVSAVKDFHLEVADGDFVIIVGPSGCGKSTTLRMIAGLEEMSGGRIFLDGEDITGRLAKDRDMAMVFQNYALYPHMTVFENISFGLKIRKAAKEEIREKVGRAARILELGELLDRRPAQLSGGQRQRVAMARAIVRDPKVFLMDEPLSNLDAKLRAQMRVELARLHRQFGSTIIYVTHDQTEAMTLGNKIVVMRDGEIMQVGSPLSLYDHPQNVFVAQFIGTPQMNLFEAEVGVREGRTALRVADTWLTIFEEDRAAVLRGYPDRKILCGIRPEDIREAGGVLEEACAPDGTCVSEPAWDMEIAGREILGAELILFGEYRGISLAIKTESSRERLSQKQIRAVIRRDKLHFFDRRTGLSIQ